jgi:subtilase family serine protease
LLTLLAAVAPLGAQTPARTVLRGNVSRAVQDLVPLGRTDATLPLRHMILSLKIRPEARADLEHLLVDQHDPGSPRYHHWLTPGQFAAAFGPKPEAVAQVTGWLANQGFTVEDVGRAGLSITFSGDVATVEQAFRTPIMDYRIQGQVRHANAADPSIPTELAGVVDGVVALHNIPKRPLHIRRVPAAGASPLYTSGSGSHYLAPADFATIYDVNPLWSAGVDGSGTTIAIVGQSDSSSFATDWSTFRGRLNPSAAVPGIVFPDGDAPADLSSDDDSESDLDVEWAGAVAPGAAITLVAGADSNVGDGIDTAVDYIVNNNLADIVSLSYGACEADLGATWNTFYSNHWAAAAGEGMTVFVASGDSGAAGCYDDSTGAYSLGVNGLGSTPNNVCVGGTQFNEGGGTYWSASNGANGESALRYIPEVAWNESTQSPPTYAASGGGASTVYPKPSWQAATGVPSGNVRYVPDVALAAAGHDGYWLYAQGTWWIASGTSAATPAFAGLMALVVQKYGRQGNANPTLYGLGGPVFHDITSGDNSVPGVSGFPAKAGYDEVTGLGSVDATAMVDNWTGQLAFTPVTGSVGLLTGAAKTFSVAVTGLADGSDVTWSASPSANATLAPGSPSTSAAFKATAAGTYTLTATASANAAVSSSLQVQVHDPNLLGSGTTVTGLDLLDLIGHYGTSGAAFDLTGTGVDDDASLDALMTLLLAGWQ